MPTAARADEPETSIVSEGAERVDGRREKAARTRAALLAAADAVVRRDGVSNLTLDRVAAEAGVSKGGLLYHFSSKQELVVALLDDTLVRADDALDELTTSTDPGAFARAYLEFVRSGEHRESGARQGIFASAALDEGELAPAQKQFAVWQERLLDDDGIDPTLALLARVVGDGLWLIDLFGLAPPSDDQRGELIDLVNRLIDGGGPAPAPKKSKAKRTTGD